MKPSGDLRVESRGRGGDAASALTGPCGEFRLEIRDLSHVYPGGVTALDSVCLGIERGVFGLLGPNGAGKTTLMEILALRKRPTRGAISFCGTDLLRRPEAIRPRLGYLPQEFDFLPGATVEGSLRLFAQLFGFRGREARRRAGEAMERARLGALARRRLRELSGGERRRWGIAQAILNDPALLIADEPAAGLDAEERLAFHNLIAELGEDRIVLFSTHIVRDIESACGRLAALYRGRILFHDAVDALVARAEGKTWELRIAAEEIDRWTQEPGLVSVRAEDGAFAARIVADHSPAPGARAVAPGLEDAYILLVGREGRNDE